MFRRILSVLCLLVVASFAASSVSAMPPGPKLPPPPPRPPARPYLPFLPERTGSVQDGAVSAQSIALGKPGTAFRYSASYGTPGQAYVDSNDYLNGPFGLTIAASGRVYFAEQDGARLFAYNGAGSLVWRAGTAGLHDRSATDLAYPNEVALGPESTLWVADRDVLSVFDADTGEFLRSYQAPDYDFAQLRGVAFDKTERLFVSDYDHHTVQVFTLDDSGDPVQQKTIGLQDNAGAGDDQFDSPTQIAVDSNKKLYVADSGNNRVQVCTEGSSVWTCTLYADTDHVLSVQLDHPYGLGIDSLNRIYIADTKNNRVLRCTTQDGVDEGDCAVILSNLQCPVDAALVPGTTHVLVSEWCANAINEYDSSDASLVKTYKGDPGFPYPSDTLHFNSPRSVRMDATGNLILLEEMGRRVVKLNKTGPGVLWSSPIWTGSKNDPIHPRLPHSISLDKAGNVIVSGPGAQIWLLNGKTGEFVRDLTADWNEIPGFAASTVMDAYGNTYVADIYGQRVLVFNKANALVRTLGTGDCSPANDSFCWPQGLALDRLANLYVADSGNCRVQKFDKLGNYKMTFSTQKCGEELDRLNGPEDVAVDSKGNVYAADTWNNRIQVYNAAGAYLTTIGGEWGGKTGQLRNPSGLTLDSKGAVYAADEQGHRIVKYTPGVPYAAAVSINGFGKKYNHSVAALAPFKGQLFAGVYSFQPYGAQILRQTTAGWETVMNDAFEREANQGIITLAEYKGFLYAGTQNCYDSDCVDSDGAEIYRSPDGLTWQPVMTGGFDDTGNTGIFHIFPLADKVCAAPYSGLHGADLWCSTTGDPGTWVREVEEGLDNATNEVFTTLTSFSGAVYAGTMNMGDGAEIYRKVGAGDWELVKSGGFGNKNYYYVSSMAAFKGYLYTAISAYRDGPTQIYRCQTCGSEAWELVTGNGFNNPANIGMAALEATTTTLYAVLSNDQTGLEVYKWNGKVWSPVVTGGFTGSANGSVIWDNSTTVLKNILYIGTMNTATGGGVWKVCAAAACR